MRFMTLMALKQIVNSYNRSKKIYNKNKTKAIEKKEIYKQNQNVK